MEKIETTEANTTRKEALDLVGRNALGCNSLKSGVQL